MTGKSNVKSSNMPFYSSKYYVSFPYTYFFGDEIFSGWNLAIAPSIVHYTDAIETSNSNQPNQDWETRLTFGAGYQF